MRRSLIVVAAVVLLSICGGAFAVADQPGARGDAEGDQTITTLFGEEPASMGGDMQAAVDAGPEEVQCEPSSGDTLVCTEVSGEEALAAARRGETVYGRNAMGIPGGATAEDNTDPAFEADSLVCDDPVNGAMECVPMSVEPPTVTAGTVVFVYYDKFDVEFTEDGDPVMYSGHQTVPLIAVDE